MHNNKMDSLFFSAYDEHKAASFIKIYTTAFVCIDDDDEKAMAIEFMALWVVSLLQVHLTCSKNVSMLMTR